MEWKLGGVVLACLLVAGGAEAADPRLELLCEGTAQIGNQLGDTSFLLTRYPSTGLSNLTIPTGELLGILDETAQHFRGVLPGPDGRYSVSVDRFSGAVLVIRIDPPPANSKASFWGTCRKADRKF
jgi:hypothetical protein